MPRILRYTLTLLASLSSAGCSSVGLDPVHPVDNYIEVRHSGVVIQRLDYSCGGASLATVLTYYWGRKVSEEYVLRVLAARYSSEAAWNAKMKQGFSLDDLEFAAAALGFHTQSAAIPLEELEKLNGPVIVHLDKGGGFTHFSVVRRVEGDTVYLADSILGKVGLSKADFSKQYTGNALAVWLENADLPKTSAIGTVRDGVSVSSTLGSVIRNTSARAQRPGMF